MIIAIRIIAAAVWIVFGFVFKILGVAPHHRLIVATILGDDIAAFATILIGILETALGLWILSGLRPVACAVVQTVAIASMNLLELIYALSLLLNPMAMILANSFYLSAIWYAAVKSIRSPEAAA